MNSVNSMKIQNKVCIIGMGYVGLTLAVVLAERGFTVTGVEVNRAVVDQLNQCQPHFHEQGLQRMMRMHLGKNLFFTPSVPHDRQDVFIIAVGTPVDPVTKKPQMHFIVQSSESIEENIRAHPGEPALIILRSTVPVGVTRSIVKPILDRTGARLRVGRFRNSRNSRRLWAALTRKAYHMLLPCSEKSFQPLSKFLLLKLQK